MTQLQIPPDEPLHSPFDALRRTHPDGTEYWSARDLQLCNVEHCEKTVYCKGFCRRHYDLNNRNGTPAPLGERQMDCESCGASITMRRGNRKYCTACLNGRHVALHAHRRTSRASKLRLNYNLTLAQYDDMVKERNGVCDICKKVPKGQQGSLCVDHDHETGRIRGLLCSPCNRAVGMLGDTYEGLMRAIAYLAPTQGLANQETS
ncbi:endonuclease domain-containing protein (plasmid) [Deinococcus radiomollis]|uniref:endonuclease VII domain-containing protein n=1 Tax=Deinococcus radiomollis TaxID=468916 RepID=UPI003891EAE6